MFSRWRFVREMRNSWWAWLIGAAWTVLGVLSTLSLLFPHIGDFTPKWPWYVWVIGFLVIGIVTIFEGAYSQARILWRLTDPSQINEIALINSKVLAALMVYPQIFTVTMLEICEGIRLNMELYIFVNIRLTSAVDVSVFNACMSVKDERGKRYVAKRVFGLEEWRLLEEFFDDRFNSTNARYIPLQNVALQVDNLQGEMVREGWIGFEMPSKHDGRLIRLRDVMGLKIEIVDAGQRKHRLDFPDKEHWPATNNKIYHVSMMDA